MAEDLNAEDFKDVVMLLARHGVEPVQAQQYVTATVKSHKATFYEVYGRGGLGQAAEAHKGLNVRSLRALDLRTLRPDGEA